MELIAPSRWKCVDFISDLHLHPAQRRTFVAWAAYLSTTRASAVFILGDLFEAWPGDDVASQPDSFEAECVSVLRQAGLRLALHIMPGNRDFLMGPQLMQRCCATALPDPCVLAFAGNRWVLSHGDALCLDDQAYQRFRLEVRSAAWQQNFLAKPLMERQAIARSIRETSAARKREAASYADVDRQAALGLLAQSRSMHLLHGHTHRPAQHDLGGGMQRTVLSDWDMEASPQRAQVLRLSLGADGAAALDRLEPALA